MPILPIKFNYLGEKRRTQMLHYNANIVQFRLEACCCYDALSCFKNNSEESINFSWIDDMNDKVTLSTNGELSAALLVMEKENRKSFEFEVNVVESIESDKTKGLFCYFVNMLYMLKIHTFIYQ